MILEVIKGVETDENLQVFIAFAFILPLTKEKRVRMRLKDLNCCLL
jgi:hypothetical protein